MATWGLLTVILISATPATAEVCDEYLRASLAYGSATELLLQSQSESESTQQAAQQLVQENLERYKQALRAVLYDAQLSNKSSRELTGSVSAALNLVYEAWNASLAWKDIDSGTDVSAVFVHLSDAVGALDEIISATADLLCASHESDN